MLERLLGGEQPGRHDDDVEAVERLHRGIQRGRERGGVEQVAMGDANCAVRATDLQVGDAAREVVAVPSEQEQCIAALRHAARQGAPHALGGTQEYRLHGLSPSKRID